MFMDGLLTKLKIDSLEEHASKRCNLMVFAWLHNVINKDLYGSVAYVDTIEKLRSYLKDRYS